MKPSCSRIGFLSLAALAASALAAMPSSATPGSGFAPGLIVAGHYGALDVKADKIDKWDLFIKAKSASEVGVDRLTVQPGGFSGWHAHPAPVFVTVIEGEIQWFDGANPVCSWTTYHAGQSFIEEAHHVHNVRNATGAPAVFIGVRISPESVPFRIDERKPTNCE